MQIIKCPNCGSGEVQQLTNEKYQCLGCDNVFLIHNLSKEFQKTDEHITELHKDLKETIEKSINSSEANSEEILIKRALLCVEDGDFVKAEEVLDQALNINPENAEIYAIKLMVDLSTKNVNNISVHFKAAIDNSNFEKVIRFSNESDQITANAVKNILYETAYSRYKKENGKKGIEYLLGVFQKFNGYKDSDMVCEELAKRREDIILKELDERYNYACSKMNNKWISTKKLMEIITEFKNLGDYKNSYSKIKECEEIIVKQKKKRIEIIGTLLGIVLIVFILGSFADFVISRGNYIKAKAAEEEGLLYQAFISYDKAGEYKDSVEKKNELTQSLENEYRHALDLFASENYVEAYEIFCTLEKYENSKYYRDEIISDLESIYSEALEAYENSDSGSAKILFESIIGYKDSEEYYERCFDCNYIGHDWNASVCGSPCIQCGEKKESNVNCVPGEEATCYEGQYCVTCGTLLKDALGHDYSEATCTKPPICRNCGMEGGYPLDHQWGETTCLEPTRCTVCGEIVFEAQGHSYGKDGVCYICGDEYYCECVIDPLSTKYLATYDELYDGEDFGMGYVVFKETVQGYVTLWANLYLVGEDEPEYCEMEYYIKNEDVPFSMSPFFSVEEEFSVNKVIYGIRIE